MATKAPDEITISLSTELLMEIMETWLKDHLLNTRHDVVAIEILDDQFNIYIRPHPEIA